MAQVFYGSLCSGRVLQNKSHPRINSRTFLFPCLAAMWASQNAWHTDRLQRIPIQQTLQRFRKSYVKTAVPKQQKSSTLKARNCFNQFVRTVLLLPKSLRTIRAHKRSPDSLFYRPLFLGICVHGPSFWVVSKLLHATFPATFSLLQVENTL